MTASILVVEDEAVVAMAIKSTLENWGYTVIATVNTGEKAINKAATEKPDLILMDVQLQGDMDGIEAASRLRSDSDKQEGEIKINLQKTENQIELEYSDDGIGMPKGLDWKNSSTLGLKLVRTLVENQLDGSIDMESNNGTKFTIKFNIET